jgi:1-acyl-sn-glycerol-3-phosphate acyltransferase
MPDGRPVSGGPQLMRLARRSGIELVRRYHRQSVHVEAPLPDGPTVIVGNHGFSGVVDLDVFGLLSAVEPLAAGRPIILLTHQLAWALRLGRQLETVGARPASRDVAQTALAGGTLSLAFPAATSRRRNPVRVVGGTRSPPPAGRARPSTAGQR